MRNAFAKFLSCKIHHCTTISTNRALKNRAQLRRENCAGRVATENRTIEVNIRAVSAVLELFVETFLNRPQIRRGVFP